MVGEQRLPVVLYAICTAVLLARGGQGTMHEVFAYMLLNTDIRWSLYTVLSISFQERTQESGVGRARKEHTELFSRPLGSRRFEIIKIYIL